MSVTPTKIEKIEANIANLERIYHGKHDILAVFRAMREVLDYAEHLEARIERLEKDAR